MTEEFFDPAWVRTGEFDLSKDDRNSTRTIRVRKALEELEGRSFRLAPIRADHSVKVRSGRASTYYLREGDRECVEAQYYMTLDRACRTLSLGVSIEKGHTHADAEPDGKMDATWDWPRFARMTPARLVALLSAASAALAGRPVALVVESHWNNDDEPTGERRDTVSFVFDGDRCLMRAVPVTAAYVVQYLREIDTRTDWWADVWIVADFTEEEVGKLTPEAVAQALFAFRSLRNAIRARRRSR